MLGQAEEGLDRGRGIPRSDIERVMRHYNVDEVDACLMLSEYSVEELLPERGYGLSQVAGGIIGYDGNELAAGLNAMEDSLPSGGQARVQLCTEQMPNPEDLDTFYNDMVAIGCHVTRPTARLTDGIPTTEFVLTKGSPQWAALLTIIVPVLIIGLITFGIFRIETITKALVPLLIITFGGIVLIAAVTRKPMEAAATRYLATR